MFRSIARACELVCPIRTDFRRTVDEWVDVDHGTVFASYALRWPFRDQALLIETTGSSGAHRQKFVYEDNRGVVVAPIAEGRRHLRGLGAR